MSAFPVASEITKKLFRVGDTLRIKGSDKIVVVEDYTRGVRIGDHLTVPYFSTPQKGTHWLYMTDDGEIYEESSLTGI